MFGAISGQSIIDILRNEGYMHQLSLPLTPPEYTLPEEYFSSMNVGYARIEEYTGTSSSSIEHVDHPGFTRLRTELEQRGYIKVERGWINGDRVLRRFRLNNVWFEEDDKFPCASAIAYTIKMKNNNEY